MKIENLDMIQTISPIGVQAKVQFPGYMLSIIQNELSYGGTKGLYEIAIFKGDDQAELPGITAPGDTVKGFLTELEVNAILTKMFTITGKQGVQL